MPWHATVPAEDIRLGTCREVLVADEPLLLVRTGQGVFACAAYCPHKAMNLEAAEIDGTKLTCPLHAATFDLQDGAPEEETDWAGQLSVYPVRIVDGMIEVDMSASVASNGHSESVNAQLDLKG